VKILSKLKFDFEELVENINTLVCDDSSTVGITNLEDFVLGLNLLKEYREDVVRLGVSLSMST
jgi:hypothetical protein